MQKNQETKSLNHLRSLEINNAELKSYTYNYKLNIHKEIFYYKFRINPKIQFKNILLPPRKQYECMKTILTKELLTLYYNH